MTSDALSVLFLCTGNSARSIMAEVLLNELGGGRFKAVSAGARPAGSVEPMALRVLREAGHNTEELASKGWHHFARPDSARIDLVVTVCDSASIAPCSRPTEW